MKQPLAFTEKILETFLWLFVELGSLIWQIINLPYFFHFLIGLSLIAFSVWLLKEYRRWNQGWLSNLIESQITQPIKKQESKFDKTPLFPITRKSTARFVESIKLRLLELLEKVISYFKNKVTYDIRHPYLPSITWLLIFLFVSGLFFIISHNGVPYANIFHLKDWQSFIGRTMEVNELSNTISILGGFVSIVFALIIFIAESIRDGKNPEQKRVLLKVSGLWFLITFTTLSLLNFLWFKVAVLSLLLPVLRTIPKRKESNA